jgi:hypothetical protein
MISMINKLLKESFRPNTSRTVRNRCNNNGDLVIPIYRTSIIIDKYLFTICQQSLFIIPEASKQIVKTMIVVSLLIQTKVY